MSADVEKYIQNRTVQVAEEAIQSQESVKRESVTPLNYQFRDSGPLSKLEHVLEVDDYGRWKDVIKCKAGCAPAPNVPQDLTVSLDELRENKEGIEI
ncbi:MAG: hypothetical protein GYA51_07725 [Candidatus Methanofastidiosa archaeon]|nr:hypothetical protein [Candidatus Methanofastidiosa archaeon]